MGGFPSWPVIWLLIPIILPSYVVDCGPCNLINRIYESDYCHNNEKNIEVICENYVDFERETCTYFPDYDEPKYEYDSYYAYIVTVKAPLEKLFDQYYECKALTLEQGNLTTIPDIEYLYNLENFTITGNKIKTVNFDKLERAKNKINLSNNMINNIEPASIPSSSKILDISYNYIKVLPDNSLNTFTKLQHLNLSHNMIENFGTFSFQGLVELRFLDISYNRLHQIGYAFTRFSYLQELFLSNNNITKLLDNNFINLSNLEKLDVSSNSINAIETNAFMFLVKLEVLNLESNKLVTISKQLFQNNVKLGWICFSNNQIESIEVNTFIKMAIKELNLRNNNFTGQLHKGIFTGNDILKLDVSGGNITIINDIDFANMSRLKTLNLSSNNIEIIRSFAFSSLVSLEILDLSHNKLKEIELKSTVLIHLSKLFIHHNNLEQISKNMFNKLGSLQELDLSNNNIKELDPLVAFRNLLYLDLSWNIKMKISHHVFQNITQLSLKNVKTGISFKNYNAIEVLELQSCGITNIDKLFIFNVQNLSHLNLSTNEITIVDKDSFRNMSTLVALDLSLNKITFIQPGSFIHLKKLTILNLNRNKLLSIQYGTFAGPKILTTLNLSQNMLSTFDVKILPAVGKLSLEDNHITEINLIDFFDSEILECSLRGNPVLCRLLAELSMPIYAGKSHRITFEKSLNFYSENVNGIPCTTIPNDTTSALDNFMSNLTYMVHFVENTIKKNNILLQTTVEHIKKTEKSLERFIKNSNETVNGIQNQLIRINQFMYMNESNDTEIGLNSLAASNER